LGQTATTQTLLNNRIDYISLKDEATAFMTNEIITDNSVTAFFDYNDRDSAISGNVKVVIYKSSDLNTVIDSIILTSDSQLVIFSNLIQNTNYELRIVADNYNLGYGNSSNYLLNNYNFKTYQNLNAGISDIKIDQLTTNSAVIEKVNFYGLALQNISYGSIIIVNLATTLSNEQQLTEAQIAQIINGEINSAILLPNLDPDTQYQIRFTLKTFQDESVQINYDPTTLSKSIFFTLKQQPIFQGITISNSTNYYNKNSSITVDSNFINNNSASITEVLINGS